MAEEPAASQEAQGSYIAQATHGASATVNVYTSPPSPSSQNRARFLVRLRTRYHDLLSGSLHGAVRLTLELAGHPQAVAPPVPLLYESDLQPAHPQAPSTSLLQVYTQAGEELLVLGEPGAGKSTLLLELASALVKEAERDPTQLLPVIVPLSSWARQRQPFAQWLASQVALLYDITSRLAERWVQEERLLPLLDGLDEMQEEARALCIEAINTYHRAHLHPLVVSSRKREYEAAASHAQLVLQGAVVVQPLSREQVDAYLEQCGEPVAALRTALGENPVLQEVTTTPLLLSILLLTYQGQAVSALPSTNSVSEQQQQIFSAYVERMIKRKATLTHFSPQDLVCWLGWLARQMREQNQTIFYLEHVQPDWLAPLHRRGYTWSAVRLPGMMLGVCASLLVALLLYGIPTATLLLQGAILGGLLGGLLSSPVCAHGTPQQPVHGKSLHPLGGYILLSLSIGLLIGLSFGWDLLDLAPSYTFSDWLRDGCLFGVVFGLTSVLLSRWLAVRTCGLASSGQGPLRSWKRLVGLLRSVHGQRALLIAALLGLGYTLSYGLSDGLGDGLSDGLSYGLSYGLIGLFLSLLLEGQSEGIHLTERLHWTWSSLRSSLLSRSHARMALLVGSFSGLSIGLGLGLNSELSLGLSYGLRDGLIGGLGLGLGLGLIYWMLLGLFQGIERSRIEDRARQVPNQGIRRSLRNSLLMGLISGSIIGLIGTLSVGLSNGLSNMLNYVLSDTLSTMQSSGLGLMLSSGLSYGLNFGLSYGWLVAVSGGLLACIVSGGLAVLRHYIIRLLLARSHTFPWHAPRFLEEATARVLLRRVGGGYSFPHRLLLDYLADLPQKMR